MAINSVSSHGHLSEKYLSKKVNKAIGKLPGRGFEGFSGMSIGLASLFAVGVPMRLSKGESFGSAVAKEFVEDAVIGQIGILPYMGYNMGKILVEQGPEIKRAVESKRSYSNNYNFLGGNSYVDTQANYSSRAQGVQAIKLNRMQSANLGGEARRYHK